MRHLSNLRRLLRPLGCFSAPAGLFPGLRAHSSLRYQEFAAHQPQIRKRKQRDELSGDFLQAAKACFYKSELALDRPKRILHLGLDNGFELLGLVYQGNRRGFPC